MQKELRNKLQQKLVDFFSDGGYSELRDTIDGLLMDGTKGYLNMTDQEIMDQYLIFFSDPEGDGDEFGAEIMRTDEWAAFVARGEDDIPV